MNDNAHVAQPFRTILNSFAASTPYTGDGNRSLSRYETQMYSGCVSSIDYKRCASCNQEHDADTLVQTLDGPTCQPCMLLSLQEAQAEINEGLLDLSRALIADAEVKA